MPEPSYSLIFRGDLLPGYTVADVKANFARLFKAGPEMVEKLFSGRPLALKKGLTLAQAEQLQATLAKAGAQTSVKAEGETEAAPQAQPAQQPVRQPARQPAQQQAQAGPDWSLAPMQGNLVKEHEREKTEAVQVSVDHLSLKPAEGNLVEEGERERRQSVAVDVPDWELK